MIISFLIAIICSFFIGYFWHKLKTSPPILHLTKVQNKDKKNRENPYYYIGKVSKDNEIFNVAFTAKELDRPIDRAEKNKEDFS
jgi:hypothetical protein